MFSVVVPVYNHAKFLPQALLSCLAAEEVDEVLLCDDGSQDASPEILQQFARAFPKVRDLTPPGNINRGAHVVINELCAAAGPWICVLNSDDFFIPGRFRQLKRFLEKDPCDLVYGQILVHDDFDRCTFRRNGPFDRAYPRRPRLDVRRLYAKNDFVHMLPRENFVMTTANMTFRKAMWEKIGHFADYRYVHDWDFVLRAALLGEVRYLPYPTIGYRFHATNTIKESAHRSNLEIEQMMLRLQQDFPELKQDPLFALSLKGNRPLRDLAKHRRRKNNDI